MILPTLAATLFLAAASAPLAAAQTAYVASSAQGLAVSLDTVSGAQRSPVAVSSPGAIAVTPDGATVYVTSDSTDSVVPIDTASDTAGVAIGIGGAPSGIAVSPDGRTVYVTSTRANTVTPISTVTHVPGAPITVSQPTQIAIAPAGRTAYVLSAGNTLTPIDLATGTARAPIALSRSGQAIAVIPDGSLALIAETGTSVSAQQSYVQPIDLATGQTEAPIALNVSEVYGIAVAPDDKTAYLSGFSPMVFRIDIPSRTVGPAIPLPDFGFSSPVPADDLAVGGDSANVFAVDQCGFSHCLGGGVLRLDTATNTVARSFAFNEPPPASFGGHPTAIALVPGPSAAFTATPAYAGSRSSFDARASADPGGSVTSYTWQFGNDTSAVITTAPTVGHTYSQAGRYTVTLTTVSQGGCASRFVFTGQTASCTGSPTATTTRTVDITTPIATATSRPATQRTTTGAKLRGTITAAGQPASWQFQYGTSTHYGRATTARALSVPHGQIPVAATLARLVPNTRYHYRLIVNTPQGPSAKPAISVGHDATFRTRATGALVLRSTTTTLAGHSTRLPLLCASRVRCRGRLSLTAHAHNQPHNERRTVTCGSVQIRIPARRTAHVQLPIRSSCRSLIRHALHHRINATAASHLTSGQAGFTTLITLVQ